MNEETEKWQSLKPASGLLPDDSYFLGVDILASYHREEWQRLELEITKKENSIKTEILNIELQLTLSSINVERNLKTEQLRLLNEELRNIEIIAQFKRQALKAKHDLEMKSRKQ